MSLRKEARKPAKSTTAIDDVAGVVVILRKKLEGAK